MNREEAISVLERVAHTESKWPGTEDTLEALDMAISALRQQDHFREVTKKVEPLTLDELRQMDGAPVFLVDIVHKSDLKEPDLWGGWIVFTENNQNGFIPRGCVFFSIDGYGKTWLAYRQKPERITREEDKHEAD